MSKREQLLFKRQPTNLFNSVIIRCVHLYIWQFLSIWCVRAWFCHDLFRNFTFWTFFGDLFFSWLYFFPMSGALDSVVFVCFYISWLCFVHYFAHKSGGKFFLLYEGWENSLLKDIRWPLVVNVCAMLSIVESWLIGICVFYKSNNNLVSYNQ